MKSVIRFLSFFYQGGCQAKNALYRINLLRPNKGPLPVVSVGNISFGGSEKTPLVLTLVAYLLKNGFKPAVVARGYKGKWERTGGVLSDGKSRSGTWSESGDEPFMISLNYPEIGVFVGKNRLKSCERAHDLGFQVAILDDGFQHRRLHRDLDIVLYNPSGDLPLREPLSSIKRADILLLKEGADNKSGQVIIRNLQDVDTFFYSVSGAGFYNMDRVEESESTLKEKRVLAFCGIARPERFRALLVLTGIKPIHFISFPDHFSYPSESVKRIVDLFYAQKAEVCITTEKDASKIKGHKALQDIPTYYLKIGIQTDEEFFTRVLSTLRRRGLLDA
jgi:tetraacyldisaccharide 4'-kinase